MKPPRQNVTEIDQKKWRQDDPFHASHEEVVAHVPHLHNPTVGRQFRLRVQFLGEGDTFWQRLISAEHFNGYPIVLTYCLILFFFGLFLDTPGNLLRGSIRILLSPSQLITDYVLVGGLGAALLNSGVVTLLTVLLLFVRKVFLSGPVMAAILTVSGFSLFGKNFYNTLPIMLGTILYMVIKRVPIAHIVVISLCSTALGPTVSVISFGLGLPLQWGIPLGCLAGILIGLIMPPLATSFLRFHMGFNLFNVGFTAGIVGMLAMGILRMFNMRVNTVKLLSYDQQWQIIFLMVILLLFLLGCSFAYSDKPWENYNDVLTKSGQLVTDFTLNRGHAVTLFNMAAMGLICLVYAIMIQGDLNGPVLGAWLSVVGFAAFGVHPLNAVPVMLGVMLAAMANHSPYNDTNAMLATLFGTTLSPIAGHYGPFAGILAGFCHMGMVLNIGVVHGGVNLYNNGFSGGFIAAILVPILEEYRRKGKKRVHWLKVWRLNRYQTQYAKKHKKNRSMDQHND